MSIEKVQWLDDAIEEGDTAAQRIKTEQKLAEEEKTVLLVRIKSFIKEVAALTIEPTITELKEKFRVTGPTSFKFHLSGITVAWEIEGLCKIVLNGSDLYETDEFGRRKIPKKLTSSIYILVDREIHYEDDNELSNFSSWNLNGCSLTSDEEVIEDGSYFLPPEIVTPFLQKNISKLIFRKKSIDAKKDI